MARRPAPVARAPAADAVILLDTNAVIWLHRNHARTRRLVAREPLYVSPATVLELQFLIEVGRLRLTRGADVQSLVEDDRWLVDDPPAAAWFGHALALGWTHDPFDRLIVAHAQFRGWRLATSDAGMLEQMHTGARLPL